MCMNYEQRVKNIGYCEFLVLKYISIMSKGEKITVTVQSPAGVVMLIGVISLWKRHYVYIYVL